MYSNCLATPGFSLDNLLLLENDTVTQRRHSPLMRRLRCCCRRLLALLHLGKLRAQGDNRAVTGVQARAQVADLAFLRPADTGRANPIAGISMTNGRPCTAYSKGERRREGGG